MLGIRIAQELSRKSAASLIPKQWRGKWPKPPLRTSATSWRIEKNVGRSNKHPNDSDRHACVAVADLAASWCGTPQLTVAVSVLRGFVTGGRTRKDCERELLAITGKMFGPYGFIPETQRALPAANALKNARDAFILAFKACCEFPPESLSAKEWAKHERAILGHVENTGGLVGLANAIDTARTTWDGASSSALAVRGTMPTLHSTDHARLILRGQLVERMRLRRKLSPEALIVAIKEAGGEFSVGQLKRVENGTAAPATARNDVLTRALGCEPSWADDVETQAYALAEKFAGLVAHVRGDRWFADVAARDGNDVASAITLCALVSTLRNS